MVFLVIDMAHLLKWLLSLLLLPLAVSFALEALFTVREEVQLAEISFVGIGFISYLLLYPFLLGPNFHFLEIFEHEMGHMLLHLLWRRNLADFRVNLEENDSYVAIRGNQNFWWLTALAPYYLPVFTLPLLVIRPFFEPLLLSMLDIFIGMTLAFHHIALFKEFGIHQTTDVKPYTLPLAFLLTLLLNSIFTVLVITVVVERSELLGLYLGRAYLRSVVYYDDSWFLLTDLWREFKPLQYR